jgi:hypothetical protein
MHGIERVEKDATPNRKERNGGKKRVVATTLGGRLNWSKFAPE